jgi:anti-sigma factor RsiW
MECRATRDLMFRKIDGELSDLENGELDAHLARCESCTREFRLLTLPQTIAKACPPPAPSPYFYQALKAKIESEDQVIAIWQPFFSLARRVVPSLAGITLALLSVFVYLQMRTPESDLYTAYASVFLGEDQPHRMVIAQQEEITDESILSAIAEREVDHSRNSDPR